MKRCPDCNVDQQDGAFAKGSARSKDGLYTYCRTCAAARKREYREQHGEKDRAYAQRYYAAKQQKKADARAEQLQKLDAAGKRCAKCKHQRPMCEFTKGATPRFGRCSFGYSARCRDCLRQDRLTYYARNAETIRAAARQRHHKDRERLISKMKDRYWQDPVKSRARCAAYNRTAVAKLQKKLARATLSDSYVRELIVKRSRVLRALGKALPSVLIQVERQRLNIIHHLRSAS